MERRNTFESLKKYLSEGKLDKCQDEMDMIINCIKFIIIKVNNLQIDIIIKII